MKKLLVTFALLFLHATPLAAQENNDIEVRKQLDTATRKIQNYKEKLKDKQKQLNTLESEKRQKEKKDDSISENIEIIQRLQQKEVEIQALRQ